MIVAVISDTHLPRGARRIPDACIERIRAADLVVHAGDVMTRGVLEEIEAIGPPLAAVHGNMDDAELRRALPERRLLDLEGVRVGLVHDAGPASGRLERLRRLVPDADAVIFGHSHLPLHEAGQGFQIFNPGSPTERRRAPGHTMGLAHVEDGALRFELVAVD